MNGQTSTIQLLAGFLAEALSEPGSINDVHLLLSPLGSLGEHHIRVLKCIAEPDEEGDNSHIWNVTHLPGIVCIRSEFVLVAVQRLLAVGFAQNIGIDGGDSGKPGGELISITALGRTVLDVLAAVLEDEAANNRD